jgi:hypothetical protein
MNDPLDHGGVKRCCFWTVLLLLTTLADQGAASDFCPSLPAPVGPVILVKPADARQLPSIVSTAASGTTVLLEDGTYVIGDDSLWFRTPNVTLRSKSGSREAVVLDGQCHTYTMIHIAADHTTIADLTIKRPRYHPIHLIGNGHNALLYNLHLLDSRQQLLKINPSGTPGAYNDFGEIACSLFELTDEGRQNVDDLGGAYPCYTGGIDAHEAWGWHVRDNFFKNIYCTNNSLAEHAIHIWASSRDTVVERNTIVNCARGIGFGLKRRLTESRAYPDNPLQGVSGYVGHIGGMIRNNFVYGDIESYFVMGIGLEQALNAKVYHNTVFSTGGTFSSIDVNYANSNPVVRNNLLAVPGLTVRNGARPSRSANVASATAGLFKNPAAGDLRLLPTAALAINQGQPLNGEVPEDIDGNTRGTQPDLGADEWMPTPSAAADTHPSAQSRGQRVR